MNSLRSNKRVSGHFTPSTPPATKQPAPSTPQLATPAAIDNNNDKDVAAAPPEILYSVMGTSNPPSLAGSIAPAASETRKDEHDRNIKSINDEILALQRSVDHKLELIRHLIASREVAIAHEVELSRIDQDYADEEGRMKVLQRVESFTGGGKKGGEKEKEGKGGEMGRQKKKLISYAKRGTVKRAPGVKEGQPTA